MGMNLKHYVPVDFCPLRRQSQFCVPKYTHLDFPEWGLHSQKTKRTECRYLFTLRIPCTNTPLHNRYKCYKCAKLCAFKQFRRVYPDDESCILFKVLRFFHYITLHIHGIITSFKIVSLYWKKEKQRRKNMATTTADRPKVKFLLSFKIY